MIKTKLLQIELSDIAAVTFTDILLTILTYPPAHVFTILQLVGFNNI